MSFDRHLRRATLRSDLEKVAETSMGNLSQSIPGPYSVFVVTAGSDLDQQKIESILF